MKKIVGINTVNYGSTGHIMLGILNVAKNRGYDVYASFDFHNYNKEIFTPNPLPIVFKSKLYKLEIQLQKSTGLIGCFSHIATHKFLKKLDKIKPDVLHLHNLHGWYINLPMLFRWIKKRNVKVIWTLHDCWAFTGQCAYFDMSKCYKWHTGCYDCPNYKIYPDTNVDRTRLMYKLKKRWFTGVKDMTLITPSFWLKSMVEKSFLKDYKIEVIHNGINLDVFKPTDSNLRTKLGLENKKILLGCAMPFGKRKGYDVFFELATQLDESYKIVLVGLNKEQISELPPNIIGIERTSSQKELAEYYTMADVFVNPTREEVFGLVNVESLACGTPVITFNSGGSPECIDKTCGIVVPCDDVKAMKTAIENICENKLFKRNACMERAKKFDKNDKFKEYLSWY